MGKDTRGLFKVVIEAHPIFFDWFVVGNSFDEAIKKAVNKAHNEGFEKITEAHVENVSIICSHKSLVL